MTENTGENRSHFDPWNALKEAEKLQAGVEMSIALSMHLPAAAKNAIDVCLDAAMQRLRDLAGVKTFSSNEGRYAVLQAAKELETLKTAGVPVIPK